MKQRDKKICCLPGEKFSLRIFSFAELISRVCINKTIKFNKNETIILNSNKSADFRHLEY